MRKALIFWFSFLALLLMMTSCKSKTVLVEKEIKADSIAITSKDTTVIVPKDSSYFKAELVVDSTGTVALKNVLETSSGRKLKTPKVTIKNNLIEVDCQAEAESLFFSWKEKFVKQYRELNKPIITNVLTKWQKIQIWLGRILLILLLPFLLLLIKKILT